MNFIIDIAIFYIFEIVSGLIMGTIHAILFFAIPKYNHLRKVGFFKENTPNRCISRLIFYIILFIIMIVIIKNLSAHKSSAIAGAIFGYIIVTIGYDDFNAKFQDDFINMYKNDVNYDYLNKIISK